MTDRRMRTADGNEAATSVAYRTGEVIAIYPITPASPMGELSDAWAAAGRANVWGSVPSVVEMQSEGGAAGAVHGALQAGSLATTFTASQGLLLMIPNLYKIAGELTPFVLHVAARTVATHALSIFGDHSDVMAVRQTGFALLASTSVQEAHDMAAVAQAATLASRVPFLHFFDGFRTSHEINQYEELSDEDLREMIDPTWIAAHRERALTPDRPVIRGTAQNPDTFFQAREASNRFHDACPETVARTFEAFAERTGRRYDLFEYHGHPEAERVIVVMGSAAETVRGTVDRLVAQGRRVGVVNVRLYRPFVSERFVAALPNTVERIAVLDRTKEPGTVGEPLFLDVVAALHTEARSVPVVIGGRYGLSSKEFDPRCTVAVFDELEQEQPRARFTVGIIDDVTGLSLPLPQAVHLEPEDRVCAVFYGLGSDGTVSANKNTIKILGDEAGLAAQGYFVYDSKKAGAVTVSHLRFGTTAIHAPYLVQTANFVACHQFDFLERLDVLSLAAPGATFLLNAPHGENEVWGRLPREVQEQIVEKQLEVWVIDAYAVARLTGMGRRINTIMQACFFQLARVLPVEEALAHIKAAIRKTYGKRGPELVRRNEAAVDAALAHLRPVPVGRPDSSVLRRPPVPADAPELVQKVTAVMLAGRGDHLPVSAFPVDGTWPTGTSRFEKRSIAMEIPIWVEDICLQCNQCALVCPHAAIRAKVYPVEELAGAPGSFQSVTYKAGDFRGLGYTIQVAPEDCTGCSLCVEVCPGKDKSNPKRKAINMEPQRALLDREREKYDWFLEIPEIDREQVARIDGKGSQFLQPLFEYSGACAGCGETPYIKLLTQLFGDRLLIANATGCSSIYGGNLPTTPYAQNREGRGPAWSNSLFEDNAEFGLGFRLSVDQHRETARALVRQCAEFLGEELRDSLLDMDASDESGIAQLRASVEELKQRLANESGEAARRLRELADWLVPKSVWLVGGDGWAYDIGYGGLDHVLAQDRNVNVIVLDTEVYSNTGGQQSKATPLGAAAKFAVRGKEIPKKDLGMEAMAYGHVYVAQIAFGANMNQTVQALREAEAYDGPSLVIAYSPCIAHGYDLSQGVQHQKLLSQTGMWPLYRFDPRRFPKGEPPLQLDSRAPRKPAKAFLQSEARFRMVEKQDPERFRHLMARAQEHATHRFAIYEQLAGISVPPDHDTDTGNSGGGGA